MNRCLAISLVCGNDGALYQNLPGLREAFDIGQSGLRGEAREYGPDSGKISRGRAMKQAPALDLEQHINERATFKIPPLEPLIQDIEDCQQPVLWRIGASQNTALNH
jgi:hypothetical protein